MGFPTAHKNYFFLLRKGYGSSSSSSSESSSESSRKPWWQDPANVQTDRAALLGGRFDIEELLEDEDDVAQYLCGGAPADMSAFVDWCKDNGALRLCVQAALDYPDQPVHLDIGETEWLDAFHHFGAPYGLRISAAAQPAAPYDDDRDLDAPRMGAGPSGLPMDQPAAAAQFTLRCLLEGKVTSVSIELRGDPPVPPEMWTALEDGLRGSAHLREILLDIDLDGETRCGPLLDAVAANPSPGLNKLALNLRGLPERCDEETPAMAALLQKPGLARIEVVSGGGTLHGLIVLALKEASLKEAKTLVFHKYTPYAVLGCLGCIQPRLSVVLHVPVRGARPVSDTVLRKIAQGPGSLAELTLLYGENCVERDIAALRSINKEIARALRRPSIAFTSEAASAKFSGEWVPKTLEAFFRSADLPHSGENAAALAKVISGEEYLDSGQIHDLAGTDSSVAKGAESASIASLEDWMARKLDEGEHPPRVEGAIRAVLPHGIPNVQGPAPSIGGSLFDLHATVSAADLDDVLLRLRAAKNAGLVSLTVVELVPGAGDALAAGIGNMASLSLLSVELGAGLAPDAVAAFLARLGELASRGELPSIHVNGIELNRGMPLETPDERSLKALALLLGSDQVAESFLELLAAMGVAFTPKAAGRVLDWMAANALPAHLWRLPIREE